LAVATYLKKPVIAFQEQGLKPRDGIVGFLQINPRYFKDRKTLPGKVEKAVKERSWNPSSRLELVLDRDDEEECEPVSYGEENIHAKFYHIAVTNLHHRKTARNCTIYLKSIKSPLGNMVFQPVEIKWKGMKIQQALIPPKYTRDFDGIVVLEKEPNEVYVGINPFIIDYSGYSNEYRITDAGTYELEYVVFSENFRPAKERFILEVGANMDIHKFYRKSLHV
jgi:hypothetical protein